MTPVQDLKMKKGVLWHNVFRVVLTCDISGSISCVVVVHVLEEKLPLVLLHFPFSSPFYSLLMKPSGGGVIPL